MYRQAVDEDYEVFASQKDRDLAGQNLIVVDSGRLTLRLVKASSHQVLKVLCPLWFFQQHQDLLAKSGAEILIADEQRTRQLTGFRIHQGVMALAVRPSDIHLEGLDGSIVALNGVNNAENVGTIIRNAVAFNAPNILVDGKSCSPWLRRAIRVSMGSVFKCSLHHCQSLVSVLQDMKKEGFGIVAADNNAKSNPLGQHRFSANTVLVLGNEGEGIDPEIIALADHTVHIPMSSAIDSLNVAVASGIFLHAMNHQKE